MSKNDLKTRTRLSMGELVDRVLGGVTPLQSATPSRALDLSELEEHILLRASPVMVVAELGDGAPADSMSAETATLDLETALFPQSDASGSGESSSANVTTDPSQVATRELVFLDTSVEDYQTLLNDLWANDDPSREIEVVLLQNSRDGVDQITEALAERTDLDAVDIVSHGTDSAVKLGSTWLSQDSLAGYAGELARWGHSLSGEADLLFYGCDLASSPDGEALLESIQLLTGADVAASIDDTGTTILGADWDLEYELGSLESAIAFSSTAQAEWFGTLDAAVLDATSVESDASAESDSPIDQTSGTNEDEEVEYLSSPPAFEENLGQTGDAVDFLARGSGYTVLLSDGDAVLSVTDGDTDYAVRLHLAGGDPATTVIGQNELGSRSNYLVGDSSEWQTDVVNFGQVRYSDVYEGIDVAYYGNQRQLEYDFIVEAGADAGQIQLNFDGAEGVYVDGNGELAILLSVEGDEIRFNAPYSYQETEASRQTVVSRYRINADGSVGFELGDYDASRELVIAPVLNYGAYLDSSDTDLGGNLALAEMSDDAAAGSAAVVLDADVQIFDAELSASDSFNGATLTLVRDGGANGDDEFSATGNLSTLTESGNLVLSAVTIGTVTTNSSGTLVVTFNAAATQARVNETLQSIAYANGSDAPSADALITWSFSDGNTGSQGTGGALAATGSGAPGLDAWGEGEIVAVGDPNLALGDNTNGTLASIFDLSGFAADLSVDLDGIDYVSRAVIVGTTTTVTLQRGDLLLSTNQDETLGGLAVSQNDLVAFRPDTVGDFSSGSFFFVLNRTNDAGQDLKDFALVETDMTVGGVALSESDFLLTDLLVTDGDVERFQATVAGSDTGTLTVDFSANGTANDRLAVRNQGTGSGQIGVSGSSVTYEGTTIGTFSGGTDGFTPLVITFNASATPAAAQALARNITFGNVSEDPSTTARTVRIVLTDGDGGTSAPATQTINVAAVNDAPTVSAIADQTPLEDTATGAIAFTIGDVETAAGSLTVTATSDDQTISPATFALPENSANTTPVGTVVYSDPDVGDSRAFLITAGNTDAIFTIDAASGELRVLDNTLLNFETTASYVLGLTVEDGANTSATQTVAISVVDENDVPVPVTNLGVSVVEGASVTISSTELAVTDEDELPSQILFSVVSPPAAGRLELTGNPGVSISSFTQDDIDAGRLQYVHDGSEADDGFTFSVSDGSGGTIATTAFSITNLRVNDAPFNAVPTAQTVNEDSPLVFSSAGGNVISVSDVDLNGGMLGVRLVATNGTLTLSSITGLTFANGDGDCDASMVFAGTMADVNAALDGLTFDPTTDYNGSATVRIVSRDMGSSGSGGEQIDDDTINITVDAVNDAPVAVDDDYSIDECNTLTVSAISGLLANDSDIDLDGLTVVSVTGTANGALLLNADGSFVYTPDLNFNGIDSFTYQATDDGGTTDDDDDTTDTDDSTDTDTTTVDVTTGTIDSGVPGFGGTPTGGSRFVTAGMDDDGPLARLVGLADAEESDDDSLQGILKAHEDGRAPSEESFEN